MAGDVIRRRALIGALLVSPLFSISRTMTPAIGTTPSLEILDVSYWKNRFDRQAARFSDYNRPLSLSGDSNSYYNMAYGVDGYLSMFEATGQEAYLDVALRLINNVIDDATPSTKLGSRAFNDSYLGWVSQREDVAGREVPLFESYLWRYVCRLLTALKANASVYGRDSYKRQYDSILAFTEVNIFDKWYMRGGNRHIYRQNTNMASHWAYIALHLRRHTLNSVRKNRCDAVHAHIASVGLPNYGGASLKRQMQLSAVFPGAYSWSNRWASNPPPAQDVSHSNGEISYIVEGRDYTGIWTSTDIRRLCATLRRAVMPRKPMYVDGTGKSTGWIADGFVKLGRFSATVQKALETYEVQGQGQYMAAMAENARRLLTG